MENKPKISVIIPVYNTEKYLRTCLDSLLIQDYKDIEYILIDDGSTDSSLEICNEYKNKDARFVVYHKENGGPSSARNLALSIAKGEYITFVDSDDYIEPGAYIKLNELINKEQPDIIVFGATPFPKNAPKWVWELISPRDVIYNRFEPKILFEEVGTRPFLWIQLVKREIVTKNKLRFDESMNLGEDQLFQISYFTKASKIVFISERLYHYRVFRDGSLMQKYSNNLGEKLKIHIILIKKIFNNILLKSKDEELKTKLFNWSIFFIWSDIINLLTLEQTECAQEIIEVWKKFKCDELCDKLDIWGQSRYNQIVLMAANGNDIVAKIQTYRNKINLLENEIAELKSNPKLKKVLSKNKNKKTNKISKVIYNFKNYGFKYTMKKIFIKLKEK